MTVSYDHQTEQRNSKNYIQSQGIILWLLQTMLNVLSEKYSFQYWNKFGTAVQPEKKYQAGAFSLALETIKYKKIFTKWQNQTLLLCNKRRTSETQFSFS